VNDNDKKKATIETVVAEVVNLRRRGHAVEYTSVERDHPELMPELQQRLRRLRAIERAADENAAPADTVDRECDPQLSFLRRTFADCDTLERIDYGGQGVVYKAIQRGTKRPVALKLLLDGGLASQQQRRRFAREVELVARLKHPNIVAVYDSGEIEGRPFILMEYVDGVPIDDYVAVHEPSTRATVALVCTVCRAVSAAHQQGIIHRDLKPANILVDDGGQPRVLDFGLAKDVAGARDESELSLTGQVLGTLPYLSPEQADGAGGVDVRSDIYTLGVVLYELLTGERPYPVEGDRSTALLNIVSREPVSLRKVIARRPSDGRSVPPDINDDLEKVVLKALAKEPERRYQSADALAEDLDRFLSGDAVHAKSDSRLYLLRKTLRRFRIPVVVSAAFLILLLVSLATVTTLWRRADRIAHIAMTGLEMGSLLKLGSVERDASRIDQAIAMFEKVIEMGSAARSEDPLILRQLVNAHHRLAEILFEKKRSDAALPHANEAIRLVERQVRRIPDDPEWRSLLGAAFVLRGRSAFYSGAFEDAFRAFGEAASVQDGLLASEPQNESLRGDLAYTLAWEGWSARKKGDLEEAGEFYRRSYAIYASLAISEPQNIGRALDAARAESKLAAWHISYRTTERDVEAREWLRAASTRLATVQDWPRADDHRWDIESLLREVAANEQLLERRRKSISAPNH